MTEKKGGVKIVALRVFYKLVAIKIIIQKNIMKLSLKQQKKNIKLIVKH